MKLQYWGTAAAEGIPGVFCGCDVCKEAREKGGRYVRTRSQILLDDSLLIDFGSDTYTHSLKYGFDMSKLEHVLITHVHMDHFYPAELLMRKEGYSHNMSAHSLVLHGSEDVSEHALRDWDGRGREGRAMLEAGTVVFDAMKPYESREMCGFKVTALPATHGTPHPYVYLFEKEGKNLLVHNDSGYFKPEVMEWLRENNIKFDFVSYECTFATRNATSQRTGETNHLGIPNVIEERRRFIENGNYKETTRESITHFSHNSATVGYGDMLGYAEENGFILAYDGLIIEI
ncbi:MAG: MBL fold metallo-hydrolase [Ruminococcaceae bacterium]|nr:MBL fold metallo-hydrolase [Oscillospiraceae bacterium]